MDPRAKALRANLQQLEKQIEDMRRTSQEEMLNRTAQEVAAAQKNLARVEAQSGAQRQTAIAFTSRFAEHQARAAELAKFETELGQSKQRLAQLERRERPREPKYRLLGRPAVPEKPTSPDYRLYTIYSLCGAFAAALLVVVMLDYLQPRPKPALATYPQPVIQIAYPQLPLVRTGYAPPLASPDLTALPSVTSEEGLMKESAQLDLTVSEVDALWQAATSQGRLVIAALFSGLTLNDLAGLTWQDIDLQGGAVHIRRDGSTRTVITPFKEELAQRPSFAPDTFVFADSNGQPLSVADLSGLIAAAAHDAGLKHAGGVDAESLRYTHVTYLVREGCRLSELHRIVGPIPPAAFLKYSGLSTGAPPRGAEAVDPVFPAFRLRRYPTDA